MSGNTLGDKLPEECARVRELIGHYHEVEKTLGGRGNCQPAIMMMEAELRAADRAMIEGDIQGMLAAYQSLKECE